jgi:hypothetical protein
MEVASSSFLYSWRAAANVASVYRHHYTLQMTGQSGIMTPPDASPFGAAWPTILGVHLVFFDEEDAQFLQSSSFDHPHLYHSAILHSMAAVVGGHPAAVAFEAASVAFLAFAAENVIGGVDAAAA